MKRILLAISWLLVFSLGVWAQSPRYVPTDRLRAPNQINELPRYGGLRKTPEQVATDQRFIAQVLQQYGTAQAAAQAHVNFGWHYLTTGHAPTAIKRFNQAWLLDSTAADVYYGFSAYLHQQNRPAEAAQYEALAQRHDTHNKGLVRYYASTAHGQAARRDYAAAIATNEKVLALTPNDAAVHSQTGYWYMQQQDTARAVQFLTRATELNPQDSVAYLNRGWVRYGQKQYAAAVADYTRAITINPHYVSAYANRALAYTDAGNHPAALANWQTCLQLVPPRDKSQFYRLIGMTKLKANDKTGACDALHQALQWGDEPAVEKQLRQLIKKNCR
ncbi:tetratricopeptide repeat protein [Hymenobacter sp. NBH84]|uniref:tetratricopeptide repeat protein n=1 Tax=Hymenobacter sp. NBH84 TaxID=2596915 RepID=UPI001626570D|nr:tetratricopeptide repeat protein [Hymenobacter sp. NBH84]QNE39399.1 tetratricopeptide repeat protein [Hymenobacter sp. NBH84]